MEADGAARRGELDGVVQQVVGHLMDQVRVGIDQHLFVHGQAFDLDHAVVDALLSRERHAGEGLPDVEHPGVDLVFAAFQLGKVQHVLDEPRQTAGLLADQLQVVVLHVRRDGAVQDAVHKALDGGHGGTQLVGDVAHELAPGIIVILDVLGHAVEGAGKVGHFAFALHAFHAHGQVTAAKALGRIGHLLQRVGQAAHQKLCQQAGAQQHHAGRKQEVGPELLLELGELIAGGAQEHIAAGLAVFVAHLADRDVAFLAQHAVQRAEHMVVIRAGSVDLLHHLARHGVGFQLVRAGCDHHLAVVVCKEQIGLSALADDLKLCAQSIQLVAFRQRGLLGQILGRALGDAHHLIQRFVAVLCKVVLEQHPLGSAHQHDAQHHEGGHQREERGGNTFAHY